MTGYVGRPHTGIWYNELRCFEPIKQYPEPPRGLSFKALKLLGAAYLSARVG